MVFYERLKQNDDLSEVGGRPGWGRSRAKPVLVAGAEVILGIRANKIDCLTQQRNEWHRAISESAIYVVDVDSASIVVQLVSNRRLERKVQSCSEPRREPDFWAAMDDRLLATCATDPFPYLTIAGSKSCFDKALLTSDSGNIEEPERS